MRQTTPIDYSLVDDVPESLRSTYRDTIRRANDWLEGVREASNSERRGRPNLDVLRQFNRLSDSVKSLLEEQRDISGMSKSLWIRARPITYEIMKIRSERKTR